MIVYGSVAAYPLRKVAGLEGPLLGQRFQLLLGEVKCLWRSQLLWK